MVKLLLDRADVEADLKHQYGRTPLWWAAWDGHEAVVRLLLENGAELEYQDFSRSSYTKAASRGSSSIR